MLYFKKNFFKCNFPLKINLSPKQLDFSLLEIRNYFVSCIAVDIDTADRHCNRQYSYSPTALGRGVYNTPELSKIVSRLTGRQVEELINHFLPEVKTPKLLQEVYRSRRFDSSRLDPSLWKSIPLTGSQVAWNKKITWTFLVFTPTSKWTSAGLIEERTKYTKGQCSYKHKLCRMWKVRRYVTNFHFMGLGQTRYH